MTIVIAVSMFIVSLYAYIHFLVWNEKRKTLITLKDPLHEILPNRNTVWWINKINTALVITFGILFVCHSNKNDWLLGLINFTFLLWIRSIMMLLCPFAGPKDCVPLKDSLINCIIKWMSGFENELRHDMFFSGHISVLFMFALLTPCYSWIFYFGSLIMAINMLISRIHYAIDLMVAPFISFTIFHLVRSWLKDDDSVGEWA